MIKNYFKIAWRNLTKHKLYSSINIFGLSIGLSACLLIGLYISNELKYDTFHEQADNIVRVTMEYGDSGDTYADAVTGTQVGPEFKRTFPQVSEYVRTYISSNTIKQGPNVFVEDRILYADESFFNIFSFDFIAGQASSALDAPDKIVLTQSMAKKYFGDNDPIGEILIRGKKELKVSGVCIDPPQYSQIKFDFVTQFFNLGNNAKRETWWSANWFTYLLLKDQTNIAQFEDQINSYMDSDAITEQTGAVSPDFLHYHLEPLKRVHLYSPHAGFEPNGSIQYIYIFGFIALLILLIASANYTNLAIAQSMGRGGEIGTRKILGASKKQIFFQFIGESSILTAMSTTIALLLSIFAIPFFNSVAGKSFEISDVVAPTPILLMTAFGLLVSFIAGLYPALILAQTKITNVLKAGLSFSGFGGNTLRKSLIVAQFSISLFLIALTSIIIGQLNFVKNTNLGYDRDQVLVLPIRGQMRNNLEILKEAFQNVDGVQSVTASYEAPEFVEWGDGINVVGENGPMEISLRAMPVYLDFAKTLGMEFAAGRDFIKSDFALMDTTNESANYRLPYIINETLAKKIGWTPEEAIGKTIENRAPGPIVGVLKDFHFTSLHEPVGPLIQFLNRDFPRIFMIKIGANDLKGTLNKIENVWTSRIAESPFSYHFLDEDFNKLYASEERSATLFKSASALAILLAILGLFGLAAFVTIQRTKEIGIRRVLGASISGISYLFAKQFLQLVLIAIVIAIPLAWMAGSQWLQDFSYRINISWWHFVLAGIPVLIIALVTICYHTIKACLVNPVNSLRSE